MKKQFNKRIGKFYVSVDIVHSRDISRFLIKIAFVPLRVECLMCQQEYEYVGTSPFFARLNEGCLYPQYNLNDLMFKVNYKCTN